MSRFCQQRGQLLGTILALPLLLAICAAGCGDNPPPPAFDDVPVERISNAIIKFKTAYDAGAPDLQSAEAAFLANLTDADADLILKGYLAVMQLETGTDGPDWAPPPGLDALLQRYKNVPYLSDLAATTTTSATTTQSLGVSSYALVQFPFTPACAPPGCHDQVRQAVLKVLIADALVDTALKELLGDHWSELAKKCADGMCTAKDLADVAADLFAKLLVPELRLTFVVLAYLELANEVLKYSQQALKDCYDYQTAHCQMDMAMSDLAETDLGAADLSVADSAVDLATGDLAGCTGAPPQEGQCPPNLPAGAVCCPGPLSPGAQYRTWCQPGQNGGDPWGCYWCAGWHNVCSGGIWVCGAEQTPSGRNYCLP